MLKAIFTTADLFNKRVFLRADLNVPLENSHIMGDDRLVKILPTLNALVKKGARIILATHLGKPKVGSFDKALSTIHLLEWFKKRNFTITFAETPSAAVNLEKQLSSGSILLLENLRFFPGEKMPNHPTEDLIKEQKKFVISLFELADYYINDAFGLLHRTDSSITLLPTLFATKKRSIGLLIEKELKILTPIREHPHKPYVITMGGGKVADKLPVIERFFDKATTILVGPAISFTFMQAMGFTTGKSLVVPELLETAKMILDKAKHQNVKLIFPVDYQVALGDLEGKLTYYDAKEIPSDGIGVSIGPKTIELFRDALLGAQTVYVNGTMGIFERPETMKTYNVLLQTIAQLTNTSIIGGGESVTAVHQIGIQDAIAFCSTGGGSTLHYLAGDTLPGLASFT